MRAGILAAFLIRKGCTFERLLVAPVGRTAVAPLLTLDLIAAFPVVHTSAVDTFSALLPFERKSTGNKLLS